MAIPKKYQLQLNEYGNLDFVPNRWKKFPDAEISTRSKYHRQALKSERLFTYKVLTGFRGGDRYGWKPVLVGIIHQDQLPLFWRLVTKIKSDAKKESLKREKAFRKYQKTPEYQQELQEKRKRREQAIERRREQEEEQQQQFDKIKLLLREIGIHWEQELPCLWQMEKKNEIETSLKFWILLAENLLDIREAHPDWLSDAHAAMWDGVIHRGIMLNHIDSGLEEYAGDFHTDLCIAIRAHRRHRDTNYDELLDEGFDRDEAREFCTLNT